MSKLPASSSLARDARPLTARAGVLGLQGDFAEHLATLERIGVEPVDVRRPEQLDTIDALIIPGGESTTMTMLMERVGLLAPLRHAIERGLPVLATCAGMIVLAREVTDAMAGQEGMGLLDIKVRRNGYGRQVDSFEADLELAGDERPFPGVFIRAPIVEDTGSTEVIARHEGDPVGVRQGSVMALAFHPELSGDLRLHEEFVHLVEGRAS